MQYDPLLITFLNLGRVLTRRYTSATYGNRTRNHVLPKR